MIKIKIVDDETKKELFSNIQHRSISVKEAFKKTLQKYGADDIVLNAERSYRPSWYISKIICDGKEVKESECLELHNGDEMVIAEWWD